MTVILFIPSACRALFQPEKEIVLRSKLVLRGLLAQEAQEHPGPGEPVSRKDQQTSAGALGTTLPQWGAGAFRISFGSTGRVLHAEGHSICCVSGGARWWGFGRVPSISVSPLTHSVAPKCKREFIMVL